MLTFLSNRSAQVSVSIAAVATQLASVAFVYWLIKREIGAEALGLWSLVLSYVSIVNFSGFGLGQTMVHFAQADFPETDALERHFRVASALTAGGSLIFGIFVFFVARELIIGVAGQQEVQQINVILFIMLVSFCTAMLNRVTTFTLTGLGFFWIGQLAVAVGGLAYGATAYFLVPNLGLSGASYGHLAMNVVILILGWLSILVIRIRQAQSFGLLIPFAIYRKEFRSMISLGMSFQATSILMMFLEPIARTTIAYSGGLALVGYYEMANRFVLSLRELIARPAAFLGGHFAARYYENPKEIEPLFTQALKRFWLIGVGMLLSLALLSFPVADYWVQERHWFFFLSVVALSVGWSLSVPSLVPWNWGVGVGHNRFNLNSTFIMVVTSLSVCVVAAIYKSPILVSFGVGGGIAVGAIYLILRVKHLLKSENWVSNLRESSAYCAPDYPKS